jgi:hypothetical protein
MERRRRKIRRRVVEKGRMKNIDTSIRKRLTLEFLLNF